MPAYQAGIAAAGCARARMHMFVVHFAEAPGLGQEVHTEGRTYADCL